ncbi:MAG: hypothetical protein IT288_18210 [Bdellovibrionales bacterium]|nr:hypothetical protein [Bdellovibrionales bacterium]
MKLSQAFRCLLGLVALQIAGGALAGEHFTFTQPHLVQRNLEIPAERILFPRVLPSQRHFNYGQLIFANGAEFEGNGPQSLPNNQIYCLVNAFRTEEDQDAWEAKIPFRIPANRPFQAPLRRVTYGSSLQTLEVLGNQLVLVVACFRHQSHGDSQPLPLTESTLSNAFGDSATWVLNDLPKDLQSSQNSGETLRFGPLQPGILAMGPAFPRPSVIVKADTQMVRSLGGITAGWLKIGSLKDAIQAIAFQSGVSIQTDSEARILGRTVTWIVEGTQENVERFNRMIQLFINENQPGSR